MPCGPQGNQFSPPDSIPLQEPEIRGTTSHTSQSVVLEPLPLQALKILSGGPQLCYLGGSDIPCQIRDSQFRPLPLTGTWESSAPGRAKQQGR